MVLWVTRVAIRCVNLEQWAQEFTYIQVSLCGSVMGTWSIGTPTYRSVCVLALWVPGAMGHLRPGECVLALWVPGAMGHLHTGQFVC